MPLTLSTYYSMEVIGSFQRDLYANVMETEKLLITKYFESIFSSYTVLNKRSISRYTVFTFFADLCLFLGTPLYGHFYHPTA